MNHMWIRRRRWFGALVLAFAGAGLSPADVVVLRTLNGQGGDERFGVCVALVPDVDGDGAWDCVIGADREGNYPTPVGHGYVYSLGSRRFLRTLSSPVPPAPDGWGIGLAFCGVADINGDLLGDVLAGAQNEANFAGRAHLFSGSSGNVIRSFASPSAGFGGNFGGSVGAVTGSNGGPARLLIAAHLEGPGRAHLFSAASGALVRTIQSPTPLAYFGFAVCGLADLNGDESADYGVSSHVEMPPGYTRLTGIVHVFSGATGEQLYMKWPEDPLVRYFGAALADIGDIDGDGRHDLAVGAADYRIQSPDDPRVGGRVFLYSGASGSLIRILRPPQITLLGGDQFGCSVHGVPDADGDGVPEIIVGARVGPGPGRPLGSGSAYVFSGRTGGLLRTLVSFHEPQSSSDVDWFGAAVVGVPDVNGDGKPELIVGADNDPCHGCEPYSDGAVYIFYSCAADYNYDGRASVQDIFDFLAHWFVPAPNTPPGADFNRDGATNVGDVFAYLAAWFAGCPG